MYLPEKSIKLRQKMPTVLTSPLSQAQDRKRRAELLEAACQIHGGRHGTNCRTPGEVGLCETTVKKCSNDILVKVFSKGQKIKKKVLPKVYKENLTKYEASDENILRSIAVYYSGGVMGKRNIGIAVTNEVAQRLCVLQLVPALSQGLFLTIS